MKPIAVLVCLSCALLAAAAPQGYKYQQNQIVQQSLPVGNLRPQTPISSSGIYSVAQAPTLGQYTVQSQQQGYQSAPVAQSFSGAAQLSLPIQAPAPIGLPAPPQFVPQQQNIVYQQPQQIVQQQHQEQVVQRPAIVTKDIYIHSAPEDTEDFSQAGPHLDNVPVRKNYRIVFIKAPTQNLRHTAAALKRAQASNEEKTVIYVLSKKPDLSEIQQQLQLTQTEAKVHKPEVYFIKYKTQEEAQRAQQEIQAQYDALGGATHISDEGIAPITTVSGGSLNLGNIVPQHVQQQQQTYSQPQTQTIVQTQSRPVQQQQTFAPQGNYQTGSFGVSQPVNKYLPAKTVK